MKIYYIFKTTREAVFYYNPIGFPIVKSFFTPWKHVATVKGAKELCNFLLNTKYKKNHYKEWCKNHIVKDEKLTNEGIDVFYCVFNDDYEIIDFEEVARSVLSKPMKKQTYIYRQTPVPKTGRSQWLFANYYRFFPKPRPEDTESIDIAKRYTRNYKIKDSFVPNTYDDIPKSDVKNRNWKHYRKKQHKKEFQSFRKLNNCLEYIN